MSWNLSLRPGITRSNSRLLAQNTKNMRSKRVFTRSHSLKS